MFKIKNRQTTADLEQKFWRMKEIFEKYIRPREYILIIILSRFILLKYCEKFKNL